jgi:hypothetical protein
MFLLVGWQIRVTAQPIASVRSRFCLMWAGIFGAGRRWRRLLLLLLSKNEMRGSCHH